MAGPDPFYELESHTLIGVANIFLDCLQYNVPLEYSPPIIDPRGDVSAHLLKSVFLCPENSGKWNNSSWWLHWLLSWERLLSAS